MRIFCESVRGTGSPSGPNVTASALSMGLSSTMSYCLTQARALRGSKTGWHVRTTCIASNSNAATGVPLGARRRTCLAIASRTRGPRLSPAYAPHTLRVSSRGVSPWLSVVSQALMRAGSTRLESASADSSATTVRDQSSPHCRIN